ncbi:MAG: DoxX family protein [Roseivirga sp.]
MNTTLWILQGLLAFIMFLAGFMKLTNSNSELIKKGNGRMDWAQNVSGTQIKLIGLLEALAAFGLILPHLLGIIPMLTPLAAIGVMLTMFGALSLHLKRGDEAKAFIVNICILFIAGFVAYGRLALVPA